MCTGGLKKTDAVWISESTDFSTLEMDELYWYIAKRKDHENGINTYIMTMVSRSPRQIVGFKVDKSVNSKALREIVESVSSAEEYFTDGCPVYLDVIFPGKHRRNVNDKKDTHEIESTNADLRHYIPGLARRSRCFFRTTETLDAVLSLMIDAYNKFGEMKQKTRKPVKHKSPFPSKHLHKWRYPTFSFLDFLP